MPPKQKQANKWKESDNKRAPDQKHPPAGATPVTVNERSLQRFRLTNPGAERLNQIGFAKFDDPERKLAADTLVLRCVARYSSTKPALASWAQLASGDFRPIFQSPKTERDFVKAAGREGLPIRGLPRDYYWGKDKYGQALGDLSVAEFEQRSLKIGVLAALDVVSRARSQEIVSKSYLDVPAHPDVYALERERRAEMAELRKELYGEKQGSYALDPDWEDIIPIEQLEPPGALATIAYPDDYAEAVGYLRAIMAKQECSLRALRLTEDIIQTNPAHYTVWLYRFKIITTLGLPFDDEIRWLNEVALQHLKNYQIWHHRQMLLLHRQKEASSRDDEAAVVAEIARSELEFVTRILADDSKNYHVWTYRQQLVRILELWDNEDELAAMATLIDDDVRNNSAWSHRFFLVFSNPASTSGAAARATEPDPAVSNELIDREIRFAQEHIRRAPQNPSGWNYLRGVLTKGSLAAEEILSERDDKIWAFLDEFAIELDQDDERVDSSHALEMMADMAGRDGDSSLAYQCLRLLEQKYDTIRAGYWGWRIGQMNESSFETVSSSGTTRQETGSDALGLEALEALEKLEDSERLGLFEGAWGEGTEMEKTETTEEAEEAEKVEKTEAEEAEGEEKTEEMEKSEKTEKSDEAEKAKKSEEAKKSG